MDCDIVIWLAYLKPDRAVNKLLLARFAHALQCVEEIKLTLYSYSVTCGNNRFCRNCNYYEFETVQHCSGTTTASPKMGPSGEALWELTENHAMPWRFLLFFNSAVKNLCFSRPPKSTRQASKLACSYSEHRALPDWLSSSWGSFLD